MIKFFNFGSVKYIVGGMTFPNCWNWKCINAVKNILVKHEKILRNKANTFLQGTGKSKQDTVMDFQSKIEIEMKWN